MKRVFIPLFLHGGEGCFDCQPGHSFKADWCLDLHGFISREEFGARLQQINQYVQDIELMTVKTKRLLYQIALFGAVLLCIIIEIILRKPPGIGVFLGLLISFVLFYIAKYMIEKNAAERAIAFTNRLNELFARYNEKENPTVNWKFWWVTSYNHYVNNLDGRAYGNGHVNTLKFRCGLSVKLAALFADNALIILEINDALSDLTANTVHVNIPPDATFPNSSYSKNAYPNEMTINNSHVNNIPMNSVPINMKFN
ncbi:absent in melanoma 1-like protein [Gigaspora margarita]|uniref:Absent in melanoma 1-like protein n=1 Tax=Gigaspora margarita TaxID=4874 RepID=A0A8H4AUJ4_GIGMA|nr:absent in melanoma 1-like protein [Gigaspora margarita]